MWLNNADRMRGEIVLLDAGTLALNSKYAGQVLIAWKDIDTRRSEKPLLMRQHGLDSEPSNQPESAGKGMVRVISSERRDLLDIGVGG